MFYTLIAIAVLVIVVTHIRAIFRMCAVVLLAFIIKTIYEYLKLFDSFEGLSALFYLSLVLLGAIICVFSDEPIVEEEKPLALPVSDLSRTSMKRDLGHGREQGSKLIRWNEELKTPNGATLNEDCSEKYRFG